MVALTIQHILPLFPDSFQLSQSSFRRKQKQNTLQIKGTTKLEILLAKQTEVLCLVSQLSLPLDKGRYLKEWREGGLKSLGCFLLFMFLQEECEILQEKL